MRSNSAPPSRRRARRSFVVHHAKSADRRRRARLRPKLATLAARASGSEQSTISDDPIRFGVSALERSQEAVRYAAGDFALAYVERGPKGLRSTTYRPF